MSLYTVAEVTFDDDGEIFRVHAYEYEMEGVEELNEEIRSQIELHKADGDSAELFEAMLAAFDEPIVEVTLDELLESGNF